MGKESTNNKEQRDRTRGTGGKTERGESAYYRLVVIDDIAPNWKVPGLAAILYEV